MNVHEVMLMTTKNVKIDLETLQTLADLGLGDVDRPTEMIRNLCQKVLNKTEVKAEKSDNPLSRTVADWMKIVSVKEFDITEERVKNPELKCKVTTNFKLDFLLKLATEDPRSIGKITNSLARLLGVNQSGWDLWLQSRGEWVEFCNENYCDESMSANTTLRQLVTQFPDIFK